jgi:hypothetical protein
LGGAGVVTRHHSPTCDRLSDLEQEKSPQDSSTENGVYPECIYLIVFRYSDLRREIYIPRRRLSTRPPVYEKPPGVLHQTGGRSIPNRAQIGPRSGKVVNRSPYGGRIGDSPDPEKVLIGERILKRIYGVRSRDLYTGFYRCGPEKISKIFLKNFSTQKKF